MPFTLPVSVFRIFTCSILIHRQIIRYQENTKLIERAFGKVCKHTHLYRCTSVLVEFSRLPFLVCEKHSGKVVHGEISQSAIVKEYARGSLFIYSVYIYMRKEVLYVKIEPHSEQKAFHVKCVLFKYYINVYCLCVPLPGYFQAFTCYVVCYNHFFK